MPPLRQSLVEVVVLTCLQAVLAVLKVAVSANQGEEWTMRADGKTVPTLLPYIGAYRCIHVQTHSYFANSWPLLATRQTSQVFHFKVVHHHLEDGPARTHVDVAEPPRGEGPQTLRVGAELLCCMRLNERRAVHLFAIAGGKMGAQEAHDQSTI